ncbi:MAG TPA: hypothetical protein VGO89_08405 [Streptomyces sp.]|nr:hypothetical protein [Streptomyces sp.]
MSAASGVAGRGFTDVLEDFFAGLPPDLPKTFAPAFVDGFLAGVLLAGAFFADVDLDVFADVAFDDFCPLFPFATAFALLLMSLINLFTIKHPRGASGLSGLQLPQVKRSMRGPLTTGPRRQGLRATPP